MTRVLPVHRFSAADSQQAECRGLGECAREEVLGFPLRHLSGLPAPATFKLESHAFAWQISWTSDSDPRARAGLTTGILFDAGEVEALAVAVEAERLWPADFTGFCLRKMHDPSFRVTRQLALGGAQAVDGPPWPMARVLRWLDLELSRIEVATAEASLPPGRQSAAA